MAMSGDFNELLRNHEKKVGSSRREQQMVAFRDALLDCRLDNLGFSRRWYTWERGKTEECNIREKLDRAVANLEWFHLFPYFGVSHLQNIILTIVPLWSTLNDMLEKEGMRRKGFDLKLYGLRNQTAVRS